MPSNSVPLPPSGRFVEAVRETSRKARENANITVSPEAINRFLFSPAFTQTFSRLRTAHGMALPLNFPSVLAELNLLSILSLLNFASGYRVPLHTATGRGAFDTIRAFVFSMYISAEVEGDHLSAEGMKSLDEGKVARLMGVEGQIHTERPHESIPGVQVGELGGPLWEVVQLVTKVMKETGEVLVKGGYPNLGAFVLEALKDGEKARTAQGDTPGTGYPECEVILEKLVRAIPAFQDMAMVDGEPVYCFKKALLTMHAITLRFSSANPSSFPLPRTTNLPIFSDNVIPSLLVHLGVIDLSTSKRSLGLRDIFPDASKKEILEALLGPPTNQKEATDQQKKDKPVPKEGPILKTEQAFALRAAAIDACELIVKAAREMSDEEIKAHGDGLEWIKNITLPELDAWIWAVAKDRMDYRRLERFVLRETVYF
ncbi:hypothetical protein K474DRAFT_1668676 [Panus rudis PR-1116 ss-1]|nr:hypothetical protein K474DRAFT_1668676 [Panus rudis PR-1116 ss-1]